MKPKNEELLYFLLWSADLLLRPTWRNVNDSFESWAWRNGVGRRLAELEREKLLERHPEAALDRIVRLTESGRDLALGGRDPVRAWSRPWDGNWRLVLFDVPSGRDALRQRLLRTLRKRRFGYIQKSVWLTPDTTDDVRSILGESKINPEAFLVIEGRPAAGESDEEIVQGAWDFGLINRRYEHYLSCAKMPPAPGPRLVEWAQRENAAWKAAIRFDPLLPLPLLPSDYRGREALECRKEIFAHLLQRASPPVH